MIAGAGGALRATGRRATAIRFQQFGEGALRRALSPTFPAGEMVFFIPLRVVAENPARRSSTCSGRLGGAAAPDDVADFFLVIFRCYSPSIPAFECSPLAPDNAPILVCLSCGDTMRHLRTIPKPGTRFGTAHLRLPFLPTGGKSMTCQPSCHPQFSSLTAIVLGEAAARCFSATYRISPLGGQVSHVVIRRRCRCAVSHPAGGKTPTPSTQWRYCRTLYTTSCSRTCPTTLRPKSASGPTSVAGA